MKLLITGASGYIGSRLVPYLKGRGHEPVPLSRAVLADPERKLEEADALIHLAGIAHTSGVSQEVYRQVNVDLPERLAAAAAEARISRFVFVSSTHAATHADTSYGASKAEAERRLLATGRPEIVIVRPALVYGPAAKANFGALIRLAASPMPLPFADAPGRRSLVYIGNLLDALAFTTEQNGLGGKILTATDSGPPLSVGEIVGRLRSGIGRPKMLFRAPWLPATLRMLGGRSFADKLFGESIADGSDLFAAGWVPPFKTGEALRLTAQENASLGARNNRDSGRS